MSDLERALEQLRGLVDVLAVDETLAFVHPGAPVPKERARWSQRTRSFYTPKATQEAEESIAWAFKNARQRARQRPYTDTVAVVAIFYVASPTKHQSDGDNLLKALLDGGTKGGAWTDDRQVKAFTCIVDLDPQDPRTVVAVAPYCSRLTKAPLLMGHGRTV